MFREEDIERAINLFKRWDLNRSWKIPEEAFIIHLKEKADDSLDVAKLLLKLIGEKETLLMLLQKEKFNPTLWVTKIHLFGLSAS